MTSRPVSLLPDLHDDDGLPLFIFTTGHNVVQYYAEQLKHGNHHESFSVDVLFIQQKRIVKNSRYSEEKKKEKKMKRI